VELGFEAMLSRRPVRLRLSYLIEQGRLDDGRRDTVEGFGSLLDTSFKLLPQHPFRDMFGDASDSPGRC